MKCSTWLSFLDIPQECCSLTSPSLTSSTFSGQWTPLSGGPVSQGKHPSSSSNSFSSRVHTMDWQLFWKTFHRLEPESFSLKIYPSFLTSVWRWEKEAYMHLLHFTLQCNYSTSYISSRPGVSFRTLPEGKLISPVSTLPLSSHVIKRKSFSPGSEQMPSSFSNWL